MVSMFIQSLYVTCLGIPLITRGYSELLPRAEIHQRGILYQILKVTINSNSYLFNVKTMCRFRKKGKEYERYTKEIKMRNI